MHFIYISRIDFIFCHVKVILYYFPYWKLYTALYPNLKKFYMILKRYPGSRYVCVLQQTKIFFLNWKIVLYNIQHATKNVKIGYYAEPVVGFIFLTKQQSTYANAFSKKVITKRSKKTLNHLDKNSFGYYKKVIVKICIAFETDVKSLIS